LSLASASAFGFFDYQGGAHATEIKVVGEWNEISHKGFANAPMSSGSAAVRRMANPNCIGLELKKRFCLLNLSGPFRSNRGKKLFGRASLLGRVQGRRKQRRNPLCSNPQSERPKLQAAVNGRPLAKMVLS
jgi:hypothetical protein